MSGLGRRLGITTAASALIVVGLAVPASAHSPHEAAHAKHGDGQVLANGQNHGAYGDRDNDGNKDDCTNSSPSAYGLETAHHGPDNEPGRADGCYEANGSPLTDIANTAIR